MNLSHYCKSLMVPGIVLNSGAQNFFYLTGLHLALTTAQDGVIPKFWGDGPPFLTTKNWPQLSSSSLRQSTQHHSLKERPTLLHVLEGPVHGWRDQTKTQRGGRAWGRKAARSWQSGSREQEEPARGINSPRSHSVWFRLLKATHRVASMTQPPSKSLPVRA